MTTAKNMFIVYPTGLELLRRLSRKLFEKLFFSLMFIQKTVLIVNRALLLYTGNEEIFDMMIHMFNGLIYVYASDLSHLSAVLHNTLDVYKESIFKTM